jgi:hypothetical protein
MWINEVMILMRQIGTNPQLPPQNPLKGTLVIRRKSPLGDLGAVYYFTIWMRFIGISEAKYWKSDIMIRKRINKTHDIVRQKQSRLSNPATSDALSEWMKYNSYL